MKFRNLLLASSAVAAFAAVGQAQATPFYFSVLGGANWTEDERVLTSQSTLAHFDFDTGFIIGGAFGLHMDQWLKGLSLEVEAAYRRNEITGHYTTSQNETGSVNGHVSTFSILANAWYEIDIGHKVRPYVGGGVGWARARNDQFWLSSAGSNVSFSTTGENSGFAFQLGVGVNYQVMPGVDVGVFYRYFDGPNILAYNFNNGPDKIDNVNHALGVNLSIDVY